MASTRPSRGGAESLPPLAYLPQPIATHLFDRHAPALPKWQALTTLSIPIPQSLPCRLAPHILPSISAHMSESLPHVLPSLTSFVASTSVYVAGLRYTQVGKRMSRGCTEDCRIHRIVHRVVHRVCLEHHSARTVCAGLPSILRP